MDYVIDGTDSYIDLHLSRGNEMRRLRFLRPRSLRIDEGFPEPTHGMMILVVSSKGWEDVKVEVGDFEASHGSVCFYAADVFDLDL